MSPQLIQIAECLNEANTREIKIARCLAESLKRIQELEQSKTEASQQAKETEKKFNSDLHELAEQLTKAREENSSTVQGLSEQIISERQQFNAELGRVVDQFTKINEQAEINFSRRMDVIVDIPAEIAAIKAELAVTSVQADAPKSFNPRGAYESGEKYAPFDYVSANGSSYIALVENPTEPPSKRSKQWMLVAARGASGNGGIISASEVVGLGTAATRDVGQAAGNVLVMSADNTFGSLSIQVIGGQVSAFSNFQLGSNSTLIYGASVNDVTLTCPNTSGTIALLSQVGDRYLTSSTTSNTIGNGAKTFYVDTGLAYSRTQDITIAYDASNHMHAGVTSYNSTTGELVVNVSSHTGTGTWAAWTVNVGGISSAVIPTGGATGTVLTKASATNYDAVWSTPSVAVGGVTGLGTGVATALAVNVGSAGAPVLFNGVLGTPTSGTVTNLTGTASININGTVGATTANTGAFTTTTATGAVTTVDRFTANSGAASGLITMGGLTTGSNYSGIWVGQASPSSTNYAFLAQTGQTLFNAAASGTQTVEFRIGNSSYANIGVNGLGIGIGTNTAPTLLFEAKATTTRFSVSSAGSIAFEKTITAAGTTGAQTINKASGSVNFAASATSLVVTNSLVTTSSVIQVTVATNDTTMRSAIAVAAAGSFTIYAGVAPTAETRVNFTITN